eukprot:TRINITY_DN14441_c0_g2_i1.p1 TRINITY_DN14441_c0_g2~~TRINITY_DN14441_c0_g2_i1.p1  ORF type:complete len:528 (-),score=114.07 TRINITY_DN14441_c0_g2_i1:131-1714(-)
MQETCSPGQVTGTPRKPPIYPDADGSAESGLTKLWQPGGGSSGSSDSEASDSHDSVFPSGLSLLGDNAAQAQPFVLGDGSHSIDTPVGGPLRRQRASAACPACEVVQRAGFQSPRNCPVCIGMSQSKKPAPLVEAPASSSSSAPAELVAGLEATARNSVAALPAKRSASSRESLTGAGQAALTRRLAALNCEFRSEAENLRRAAAEAEKRLKEDMEGRLAEVSSRIDNLVSDLAALQGLDVAAKFAAFDRDLATLRETIASFRQGNEVELERREAESERFSERAVASGCRRLQEELEAHLQDRLGELRSECNTYAEDSFRDTAVLEAAATKLSAERSLEMGCERLRKELAGRLGEFSVGCEFQRQELGRELRRELGGFCEERCGRAVADCKAEVDGVLRLMPEEVMREVARETRRECAVFAQALAVAGQRDRWEEAHESERKASHRASGTTSAWIGPVPADGGTRREDKKRSSSERGASKRRTAQEAEIARLRRKAHEEQPLQKRVEDETSRSSFLGGWGNPFPSLS